MANTNIEFSFFLTTFFLKLTRQGSEDIEYVDGT